MLLTYVAPHAHGPQDSRPLQTVVIRQEIEYSRADILAWSVPNIDVELHDSLTTALPSTRMALSFRSKFSLYEYIDVLDTTLAGLPLDGLVTLVSYFQNSGYYGRKLPTERFWLRLSQMWPLLQRVLLTPVSARGFLEMLLEDKGEHKGPLFPSLTELGMVNLSLFELWSLPLCRHL
jgi:hypothetical protein